MSVEDPSVIDVIGTDPTSGRVILTVSDHLSWEDLARHGRVLDRRVRAYLEFVRSGQLEELRPGAMTGGVEIGVVFQHPPPSEAERLLDSLHQLVTQAGGVPEYPPVTEA